MLTFMLEACRFKTTLSCVGFLFYCMYLRHWNFVFAVVVVLNNCISTALFKHALDVGFTNLSLLTFLTCKNKTVYLKTSFDLASGTVASSCNGFSVPVTSHSRICAISQGERNCYQWLKLAILSLCL